MNRFLLFCGETYYPNGGMKDLVGSFDTLEDTKLSLCSDWAHVFDLELDEIVVEWYRVPEGSKLGIGGWVTRAEYAQRWRDFEDEMRRQ